MNYETLTPEQKKRYEWAIAEFNRIQEENSAAGTTTIAPGISPLIKYTPNPKSKLFARLLDGKAPLLFPPPTSYSYPWYDLIEDGFSDNVFIGGFKERFAKECTHEVIINQAVWKIHLLNPAATLLMNLSKRVIKSKNLVLTPDESREAKMILQEKPEWIIKNGRNPEFRLYQSRVIRRGRKEFLVTDLLQRDFSGGNPKLLETFGKNLGFAKNPRIHTDIEVTAKKNQLINQITEIQMQMLVEDAQLESEWANVQCDAWCLEVAT